MEEQFNQQLSNELLDFINNSPTAYHAVANSVKLLQKHGFTEIKENEKWLLKKGGKYFLTRNQSSLLAFRIGNETLSETGFKLIGVHTDSPTFKIKPGNCIVTADGYVKLNTECYGGTILSTWFDRPLSIAGKVVIKGEDMMHPEEKIINIKKPILMIPNLAIHMNREVNNGYQYNKQVDVLPFLGFAEKDMKQSDYLLNIMTSELNIQKEDILDYELFLYEYDDGILMGVKNEFISASRLDNLWMTFTGIYSLIHSEESGSTKVLVAFDNEEVGSTTAEGANSAFLYNMLNRISMNLGFTAEEFYITLSNSIAISADAAHAVHPNFGDKHDLTNRPVLGKGLAIKYSAVQKYSTNSFGASILIRLCKEANIPYQTYVNRSDMAGGSTIGPSMSSLTQITTIDAGIPILAMHSIREFGCIYDNIYAIEVFKRFYSM